MPVPDAPPRKRGWLHLATVDITPLRRHRDFRLLFIGRLVSFFGSMITVVAFPYQVYQLTHSVLLVGVLGVLEFAAILLLAMLGGALADAADRRSMVLVTEAGLMAGSLVLAGNAALSNPQVWVLFVVAVVWGGLDAVQRPSLDAMLPRLVDRDELAAAAALNSVRSTLGQILGPALGGVLLAAIGLPRARAATLRAVAGAFARGVQSAEDLRGLPGVGPWTLSYVGMRAFHDPDAFPAADLGVRKALRGAGPRDAEALVERARPFRAYAALHLWSSLA